LSGQVAHCYSGRITERKRRYLAVMGRLLDGTCGSIRRTSPGWSGRRDAVRTPPRSARRLRSRTRRMWLLKQFRGRAQQIRFPGRVCELHAFARRAELPRPQQHQLRAYPSRVRPNRAGIQDRRLNLRSPRAAASPAPAGIGTRKRTAAQILNMRALTRPRRFPGPDTNAARQSERCQCDDPTWWSVPRHSGQAHQLTRLQAGDQRMRISPGWLTATLPRQADGALARHNGESCGSCPKRSHGDASESGASIE